MMCSVPRVKGGWVSVILPCRNERWRLPQTLDDVRCFMDEHPGVVHEVIVVDDGSNDVTAEVAMSFSAKLPLRLIRHAQNRGKWSALWTGIRAAATDAVLLMDADGSAPIWVLHRIHRLKESVEKRQAIFGSRFVRGASIEGKGWFRMLMSRVYRIYVGLLYRWAKGVSDVDDVQCPWKLVFKSRCLEKESVVEGFAGDLELALVVQGTIRNQPVAFIHKGKSLVRASSIWEMVSQAWQIARQFKKEGRRDRNLAFPGQ